MAKPHHVFINLQSAILFMLSTAAAIITPAKSYEISAISIHYVVNLNFTHLSVSLHDALSKWCQMTSHNNTFIDVIGALYHIVLNKNAFFIW